MLHELQKMHYELQEIPPEVEESMRQLFDGNEKALVAAAISAEQRALHWDDENRNPKMHVGCSILGLRKNLDLSEPTVYTGANAKPEQGEMLDYPKRKCAEMNALENALGVKYWRKTEAGPYQEMEKEDLGVIAAIVTISEAENTGEADTHSHDVVYSCKQCITNYQYLFDRKLLSLKTIIYNAKVKDGQVEAGKPMTLGDVFDAYQNGKEEMHQRTLKDLIKVRRRAFLEYHEELKYINEQFGSPDDPKNKVPPIIPDDPYKAVRGYQRERIEAILEAKGQCIDTILAAIKSAAEEGAPKARIIDNLGLTNVMLDPKITGFSEAELQSISSRYEKFLANIRNGNGKH